MSRNGKANKKNQHLMIAHRKKDLAIIQIHCILLVAKTFIPMFSDLNGEHNTDLRYTIQTHSIKIIS